MVRARSEAALLEDLERQRAERQGDLKTEGSDSGCYRLNRLACEAIRWRLRLLNRRRRFIVRSPARSSAP
jgi:hypothetical protein